MRKLAPIAVAGLLVHASVAAGADEFATTKDAEMLVHSGVAFLKKEGKQKALAAFNDPEGAFVYRDLYVFAYDLEGTCLAHPHKPERVGKNNLADKDADGKEFVRERIQMARARGKGWQDYKWQNPVTRKIEQKVAYFELVDGVVIVAGAYKR